MEESFGNTEPGEGPDRVGSSEGEGKVTLSKMLEAGLTAQDPAMFRAAVHRRRTRLRMLLQ